MHQISIDFVAGTHGNFLAFACNKFLAKLDINFSPFNELGASHIKPSSYFNNRVFLADHYVLRRNILTKKVIKISFEPDDLLALSSVCLLRAGNMNIDSDLLQHNTFNKLNNKFYKNLLDEITSSYPEITLSEKVPDCPRYILREFFKFGFSNCKSHGLMLELERLVYSSEHEVFDFSFKNFYNKQSFINIMIQLADWCGTTIDNMHELEVLHQEFLNRQIYKDDKAQADSIISAVNNKQEMPIFKLKLLQESYINGTLESMYNIEMPFKQLKYFSDTKEIIEHLKL